MHVYGPLALKGRWHEFGGRGHSLIFNHCLLSPPSVPTQSHHICIGGPKGDIGWVEDGSVPLSRHRKMLCEC